MSPAHGARVTSLNSQWKSSPLRPSQLFCDVAQADGKRIGTIIAYVGGGVHRVRMRVKAVVHRVSEDSFESLCKDQVHAHLRARKDVKKKM